jgi:chromosome partitioning protein
MEEGPMRKIAVANLKGGCAKTTTALCLAYGMSRRLPRGKKLLYVDGDSSGNGTTQLTEGRAPFGPTLAQVLLDEVHPAEAIQPSRLEGIDLLPADASLADIPGALQDATGKERRLRLALEQVADTYEIAILDCPPQLSIVQVNCLHACNDVVVPVEPGYFAAVGLGRLTEVIERIRRYLSHPELRVLLLVLSRVMSNKPSRELEAQLRDAYPNLVSAAVVPYDVRIELAQLRHRTVLETAPRTKVAQAFEALITEVIRNGRKSGRARRRDSIDDAA